MSAKLTHIDSYNSFGSGKPNAISFTIEKDGKTYSLELNVGDEEFANFVLLDHDAGSSARSDTLEEIFGNDSKIRNIEQSGLLKDEIVQYSTEEGAEDFIDLVEKIADSSQKTKLGQYYRKLIAFFNKYHGGGDGYMESYSSVKPRLEEAQGEKYKWSDLADYVNENFKKYKLVQISWPETDSLVDLRNFTIMNPLVIHADSKDNMILFKITKQEFQEALVYKGSSIQIWLKNGCNVLIREKV